jgi:hypothetical protein
MIPAARSVNIPLINRMVTDGEFVSNLRLDESAAEMLDELSSWATDLGATHRGADR